MDTTPLSQTETTPLSRKFTHELFKLSQRQGRDLRQTNPTGLCSELCFWRCGKFRSELSASQLRQAATVGAQEAHNLALAIFLCRFHKISALGADFSNF